MNGILEEHGRKAFAKHLRNKKSKRSKRMANSKSRQDANKPIRNAIPTPFEILRARLEEARILKSNGSYHARDFDAMIDAL
jgi:hypothetical protein